MEPSAGDAEEEYAYSPTQIDTWSQCQRKWGWRYVAHIRTPPNKSAALGSAVHKQLENYFEHSAYAPIDFSAADNSGYIADAAIPHLPAQGTPGLTCEGAIAFRGPSGRAYNGFADLIAAPGPRPASWGLEPEGWGWKHFGFDGAPDAGLPLPTVYDHKTSSNTERYGKRPVALATDVQALVYGYYALRLWPETQGVNLQWTYLSTRGRAYAVPSRATLSRAHVESAFLRVEGLSGEIASYLSNRKLKKGLRLAPDEAREAVLSLPPSTDQCEAFGGCPYRDKCNLSPAQNWSAFLSQGKPRAATGGVDLFASLANTPAPLPEPTPEPTPAPAPEPPPAEETQELPAWMRSAVDPLHAAHAAGKPYTGAAVNPPEGQPPLRALAPEGDPTASAAPPTTDATPTQVKPKRGRPSKKDKESFGQALAELQAESLRSMPTIPAPPSVEATSAEAPTMLPPPPATPVPPTQVTPAPAVPTTPAADLATELPIRVLYVDCFPLNSMRHAHAHTFFEIARAKIADAHGVSDYRQIEYGAGPGLFGDAVCEAVEAFGVGAFDIAISSTTPEGSACMAKLMARASLVVQGVR